MGLVVTLADAASWALGFLSNDTFLGRVSGSLSAIGIVSQGDAEAGTATALKGWTAERVKQAIYALVLPRLLALATNAGDRIVRNGSSAMARLPVGSVTMGAGTSIDFAAGDVFTKTISGTTTFTATNETWGHSTVLLVLAVSGSPAEPTWPGTTTKVGTGTWSTSATNYVFLTRTGSGTYIRTVGQAS